MRARLGSIWERLQPALLYNKAGAAVDRVRFGSLWNMELGSFDLVFAFLSPAPMPRLWDKAVREMRPGALLVSHSFEIPGIQPERRIPLPGLPGACLLLYRIPGQP